MKKRICGLVAILILGAAVAALYHNGFQFNCPSAEAYPVRGVDVSHYQGDIDWEQLRAQGVMFAYIKATEGASFVDGAFQTNWENIVRTDLRAGAYHFFSFESPGQNQAENFIETVSPIDCMLPPVVDIEPYGRFKTIKDIPDAVAEIGVWLRAIESAYGMRPVIYTTEAFYKDCISDAFPDHDIWIRSVYGRPPESVRWTFWQYASFARLKGYQGKERFIDMNVFRGTVEEFKAYGQ